MFTGIIEERGRVRAVETDRQRRGISRLTIQTLCAQGLQVGASLAVDGVCLTVATICGESVTVEVMEETLARSTLGQLQAGDRVNLERPLPARGRFDGHIVLGHVDGVGAICSLTEREGWCQLRVQVPENLAPFLAEKGSVALDGISLTIMAVSSAGALQPWCEVGLIPETRRRTGLDAKAEGARVNIETDLFAKYVRRLGGFGPPWAPAAPAGERAVA